MLPFLSTLAIIAVLLCRTTAYATPADEVFQLLQRLATLLAPRAAPSVYYVAVGGNNATSCDSARNPTSPKATINGPTGGMACLAAGDTLAIGDGIWHEQLADNADQDHLQTTRPPSGASWSAPTTIKAAHPRQATLQLPTGGNHVVSFMLTDTRYVSVEGLVIDATGRGACVWVGPSSHIRLTNNLIRHCGSNGMMGSVADDGSGLEDIQIDGNEITNVATQQVGDPGAHAIYFTGSGSVIRGNYIHAPCPYYGIHATSEHGGVHDNVIENNRVVGCEQAGIISQGSQTILRNNLLQSNCIGIYLSSGITGVLHNTIYGWKAGKCSDNYGIFDKSGGSTIANNLILAQKTSMYNTQSPTLVTNMCDSGQSVCQMNVPAAGVVVDGPGGNLQLAPGSPAIGAATPTTAVPLDRLGVTRPQGTGSDIGAYEFTGGSTPPPNPTDTTKPQVSLTAPASGAQVTGTITLMATATDDRGVVGLQFQLDGANLGPELTQPPWTLLWDTATATAGAHTLQVSVRDQASNYGRSAAVPVTVVRATPPDPTPPGPRPLLVLQCEGSISQVPGTQQLRCTEQREGRR